MESGRREAASTAAEGRHLFHSSVWGVLRRSLSPFLLHPTISLVVDLACDPVLNRENNMNEAKEQKTDSEIALLAPVPLKHLMSALRVLESKDWVAFGSTSFEVFDKLEKQRENRNVEAYIYASLHDGSNTSQYWRATYVGTSEWGVELSQHRPASTVDEKGWGIFWKVEKLREASPSDWRIAEMKGFGKKTNYNKFFIPEGPILIQHP